MGRRPKVANWTTQESFNAARKWKQRSPYLLVDICTLCNTWVAYEQGEKAIHPLCADLPVVRSKEPDPNQGTFI